MGHYVYKYVLDGEIIYIGKCDDNLDSRLKCHGRKGDNISPCAWDDINKSDIFYVELANSTMSDVVESELINRYKPKYNKAKMSKWCGLPFPEPQWSKYRKPVKRSLKKRHKEYEIADNREHNAKAYKILNYILHQILEGNYEIEENHGIASIKVEITDFLDGAEVVPYDFCMKYSSENKIEKINALGHLEYCHDKRVFASFPLRGLKKMLIECDRVARKEENEKGTTIMFSRQAPGTE